MPCMVEDNYERAERQVREQNILRDNIKDLGAMLCSACKELEQYGYDFGKNPLLDR